MLNWQSNSRMVILQGDAASSLAYPHCHSLISEVPPFENRKREELGVNDYYITLARDRKLHFRKMTNGATGDVLNYHYRSPRR